MLTRGGGLALLAAGLCLGCGAPPLPAVSGTRESGQSHLMDETFAGQNACNPANHLRPFVIEWDATDRSSFEAVANGDLVFVHYEGCTLTLLDGCRDDSVRGSLGAYRAVDWTSGALESLDVGNDAELHSKLPLGVATLEGRVQAGEKFHMEYYVAGTRTATRDAVYREELSKLARCRNATHFVYAYNLGAFALGSASHLEGQLQGSAYGFGADASQHQQRQADKRGGELSACRSNSAAEVDGCKSAIRLTLRPIEEGPNPDAAAAHQPESDASLNKAGKVEARLDLSEEARAHLESALAKANARDGKGCLQELDAHDRANPGGQSTDPKANASTTRAQCLMLTGQCEAGKNLARKHLEQTTSGLSAAEAQDDSVQAQAALFCQGGDTSPRDRLIGAIVTLQRASSSGGQRDKAQCQSAFDTFQSLAGKVPPKDASDVMLQPSTFDSVRYAMIPACFARARDCETAHRVFVQLNGKRLASPGATAEQNRHMLDAAFDNSIRFSAPECVRGEGKPD